VSPGKKRFAVMKGVFDTANIDSFLSGVVRGKESTSEVCPVLRTWKVCNMELALEYAQSFQAWWARDLRASSGRAILRPPPHAARSYACTLAGPAVAHEIRQVSGLGWERRSAPHGRSRPLKGSGRNFASCSKHPHRPRMGCSGRQNLDIEPLCAGDADRFCRSLALNLYETLK
jgi:hypothetical protein